MATLRSLSFQLALVGGVSSAVLSAFSAAQTLAAPAAQVGSQAPLPSASADPKYLAAMAEAKQLVRESPFLAASRGIPDP
jgi:hypothetical protein